MRLSSLRSDRRSPQLDAGPLKCLNTTDQRMLQLSLAHIYTYILLLDDVTKSSEGEFSNNWVFEIGKYRNIGYSFGHIDG